MPTSHLLSSFMVLLWCALIFVALVGWGYFVGKLLGNRTTSIGSAAALGIASQCLLGGIYNSLHLVYPAMLAVQVLIGLVLFLQQASRTWAPALQDFLKASTTTYKVIAFFVLFVIGIHLFSFLEPKIWNPWDDLEFYLFIPRKLMQLHHLGPDPYSQRRVISSLGFNYYLQDLFLVFAPLKNIMLVDGGLGILLLCAASFDLSRLFRLSRYQALIFLFLAGISEQLYLNITFVWLPCALMVMLAVCVASPAEVWKSSWARVISLAGISAAATALKNNYLLIVVFYLSLYFLVDTLIGEGRLRTRILANAKAIVLVLISSTVLLSAWMFDLHNYVGTYFFPVLGHGFEYSTYHLLPTRTSALSAHLTKGLVFASPLAILGVLQAIYVKRKDRRSLAIITFTFAASFSITATYLATGGDSVRRYCCPQIVASLLLAFALFCRGRNDGTKSVEKVPTLLPLAWGCVVAGFACFGVTYLSYGPLKPKAFLQQVTGDLVASIQEKEIEPAGIKQEYIAMQNAMPLHATVLLNVSYPFLFDNTRQTLYDASLPAMASPPPAPGWPIFSNGEALAHWLVSHDVHYLAYSYDDQAGWNTMPLKEIIAEPTLNSVLYSTYLGVYKSHQQYLELAATRKHIFDDGHVFVLDLTEAQGGGVRGNKAPPMIDLLSVKGEGSHN